MMAHLYWPYTVGHRQGSEAKEYVTALISIDAWLGQFHAGWANAGYTVFVTGDHGTNALGYHGGTEDALRSVPLYVIGSNVSANGQHEIMIEQPTIAAMNCGEMGLVAAPTMHEYSREIALVG